MSTSAHHRWLVGAWAVCAVVSWSADALVGVPQLGAVAVVPAVLVWRRTWHPLPRRATREATAAALRRHQDPGEELRVATAAHAQESLARSPWPARVLALALLALAVGCALVGAQRADGWDAAPALPLLVVAVGALLVDRVARQRARHWVDDPPYAALDLHG